MGYSCHRHVRATNEKNENSHQTCQCANQTQFDDSWAAEFKFIHKESSQECASPSSRHNQITWKRERKKKKRVRNNSKEFLCLNTWSAVCLHENNPLVAVLLLGRSSLDSASIGGPPQQPGNMAWTWLGNIFSPEISKQIVLGAYHEY